MDKHCCSGGNDSCFCAIGIGGISVVTPWRSCFGVSFPKQFFSFFYASIVLLGLEIGGLDIGSCASPVFGCSSSSVVVVAAGLTGAHCWSGVTTLAFCFIRFAGIPVVFPTRSCFGAPFFMQIPPFCLGLYCFAGS